MTGPATKDDLSPAEKDAAEGGRDRTEDAPQPAAEVNEESHLGAAGDPAEGRRQDD